MAGYTECSSRSTCYLACICGCIVVSGVITYIIGVVGLVGVSVHIVLQVIGVVDFLMVTIGIILCQPCIHLSHKCIPVHTVAVIDRFVYFFFYVPRFCYID